ncbi:hypothetical protein CHARACLAT_027967 [Characodon lateralis]|uniref:DUF4806 domain-containing protein n=1 Tax=Characodon lateralis TaxID=208331 RepID=A0ABU7D1A5_9TELE|nr:hypothetical protein [Characodon lateralis]
MSITTTERALKEKINPEDDWMTFPLIKIKITSAKRCECESYNLTSQAEDDKEDQDLGTRSKRSCAKKGTPEGFVRSELTSSDEEESIRGVKLPNYPAAHRKLQSIHNADILNNVYSEDETMSVAGGTRARETSTFRTINQTSVNLLEAFTSSAGSQTSTPSPQYASTAPQHRDLSTPRSRHGVPGCTRDEVLHGYCYRSRHRDDASRSRHRNDTSRSRSRHLDDSFRLGNGKWALPLPPAVFQKKVLNLLMELRDQHKRAQPISSAVHIERMVTIEDLEREEERLCSPKAFEALVLQIARIGGKNTKDCVHKVLDRLFTNALMAKFNTKGKQGKRSLEKTKVYGAIKEGIMIGDESATEDIIRIHAAEHLKHATQRSGGHKAITQD